MSLENFWQTAARMRPIISPQMSMFEHMKGSKTFKSELHFPRDFGKNEIKNLHILSEIMYGWLSDDSIYAE